MSDNNTTQITEGSVMLSAPLINQVVDGIRFLSDSDDKLKGLITEFDNTEYDKGIIFHQIYIRLNEIAPDDLCFMPSPTDEADFGFWSIDQGEYEDNPGGFGYPVTTPEA